LILRACFLLLGCAVMCWVAPVFAQPQRVEILVDQSYPPYTYVRQGTLQGDYVALVQSAAKSLTDYEVVLKPMPWKRALQQLEQGAAFAILPPYKHLEKRPFIDIYSLPLEQETVVALCHNDTDLPSALAGKAGPAVNIGVNAGYLIFDHAVRAAQQRGDVRVWRNANTRSNLFKLLKQRIECYVNDRRSSEYELELIVQRQPELAIKAKNLTVQHVLMTRSAHIGYARDERGNYPFKYDFIAKMDAALAELINH